MKKEFTFVAGDLGAANAMVPVMKMMAAHGHVVIGIADMAGIAQDALATSGTPTFSADTWEAASRHVAADGLLVVGTSATATGLEQACALQGQVPCVLFSDGYFNHANPVWRDMSARWWLALDDFHAAAIRATHKKVDRIVVTGQPAFDDAIALLDRRRVVRKEIRARLAVNSETPLIVWWSTGMGGQLAQEDLDLFCGVFQVQQRPLAVACRMHPKLEKTVGSGYIEKTLAGLYGAAETAAVDWRDAKMVPGIELCLAADVLVSITCTEDIKSTLIGGPPVVHLLSSVIRKWMERDFFLKPPFYLPDVAAGLSLAAYNRSDVALSIERALSQEVRYMLRTTWRQPDGPAADRTADALEHIASS